MDIIYATFTTPSNALSGSAVCAFRLHDVEKVFDGAFKEQAALNYNWLPVPAHKVCPPQFWLEIVFFFFFILLRWLTLIKAKETTQKKKQHSMGKLTSCNRWARDNPFGMITYKLVCCFVLSGTGAEARPMRQRLSDAARRDSQLYQVAFVDGRIGSINAERTAHHPHRIPVSCIQSSPFLCVCVVQHGWISRIHAVLLVLLLFGQQFVWDSHKSLLSIYRVVKTNQSSTYKVKRVSSSVVWCCILWPDLKESMLLLLPSSFPLWKSAGPQVTYSFIQLWNQTPEVDEIIYRASIIKSNPSIVRLRPPV